MEQAWSRIAARARPLQAVAFRLGGAWVGESTGQPSSKIVKLVGGGQVIVAIPVGQPAE